MSKEHVCIKCGLICVSEKDLTKHLARKYPCDAGKYQCKECRKRFNSSCNLSTHKKTCKGRQISSAEKDKQIENYKTVLAATGNQRGNAESTTHSITQNAHNGDIINGDQINNIQNNTNIFVLPVGQENIDHIRKMTIQELQDKIGLKSEPSTMIKLFELIRTDENHPENHTMLLPDANGNLMHCKDENGWKTDSFDNSMQRALHADNSFLIRKLPDDFADKSFQFGYIMNEIQQKINFGDHAALKAIYDGVRVPLHDLTMKLAKQNDKEACLQESDISLMKAFKSEEDEMAEELLELEKHQIRINKQKLDIEQKELDLRMIELKRKKY